VPAGAGNFGDRRAQPLLQTVWNNLPLEKNEEFAARILPTLRGFKAIMAYECPPEATVSCPIAAYIGDEDEIGTADRVQPWSERTTGEFTLRQFSGHHFYINDHLPDLVADIESKISKYC
jgi:surfactin synthase thioesterase subunit